MAARAKQPGLSRPQRFAGLYGAAGGYMLTLNRRQRVQIKKLAAKRGLTVTGLLQNVPEPLRERSSAGLQAQALKTVGAAYAPAEAALSSRQTAINALDAKRKTDNQYYSDWLTNQQRASDAVSATSDAALLTQAAQLHGDAQAAGNANQQQAIAQATTTPGGVSDPSQSTALQQGLSANTTKSVGAADIANAGAVSQVARSGAQRATLQASNYAQAAALEARRQGDTYSSLAKLADDTTAEKLNKAADINKEVSRLLDNEVTKAQNNEQTAMLGQKLNIQQSQFAQSLALKKGALKVSQKNAATALTRAEHAAMLGDARFKLDQAKYGDTKAKDIYLRQHKLGPYKPAAGGKNGISLGQRTSSRKQITSINNAVSTIKQLESQKSGGKPLTSTQIRAFLNSPKGANNPYGGFERVITNAAYDIRVFGHLSPQNYQTLKAAGVLIPRQWRPPGTTRRKPAPYDIPRP